MFASEILNHPMTQRIGWVLVHFVWQGAIVGIVAALALIILRRRSASARYVVGIIALLVMATCPLLTMLILPGEPVTRIEPVADVPVLPEADPAFETATLTESPAVTIPVESPGEELFLDEPLPVVTLSIWDRVATFTPWMTAVWFIGAALLSLRLLLSWVQVWRMTRVGLSPVSQPVQTLFDSLCDRIAISRVVRVFESTLITVPATVGWLKPLVLLPATAITGLSEQQLVAILAHELAHVRRHDYAVNLLQGVIETLLFYHPAVWLLSSKVRTERENCCDDEAVALTGEPTEYARALTQLASIGSAPHLATAATGGELSTRVRRLVRRSPAPTAVPRLSGLITILTLALVGVSISSSAATDPTLAEAETEALPETATDQEPPPKLDPNPTWIIAKHAIIFEGKQVVDWNHVKRTIKAVQDSGQKVSPSFRFTYGWYWISGRASAQKYQQLEQAVGELIEDTVGVLRVLTVDRRGFDSVKVQADLQPDPKHRIIGRVLTPNGDPAARAQVVVLPKPTAGEQQEVWLTGTRLADPLRDKLSTANDSGGFTAHVSLNDETVLVIHRSGFLMIDAKRIAKGKAIRLGEWVRIRGSIDGGIGKQMCRLTAEMTSQLSIANRLIADRHLDPKYADKYPIVMPPSPVLRAERWITEVGSIGVVPVEQWKTKPGDEVQVKLGPVTAVDIETGQQLHAIRQRPPQWHVQFDHSEPIETYASQLDSFGIQLGAYFANEGRFVYLSKLGQDKPTAKAINAKTDRAPGPGAAAKDRRLADQELFNKVGIDVSKAGLYYYYPKATLEKLRTAAAEFSGTRYHDIKRCDFNVDMQNTEQPFVPTKYTLEQWAQDPARAAMDQKKSTLD